MAENIETLRERNEALERRKKVEAQGYHADVKLLQQKIKHVEHRLVGAAVAKSKGRSPSGVTYSARVRVR